MPELCTDVLKPISDHEVEKLHRILNQEWPLSSYASGFLRTCHRWQQKDPAFDVTLYSYRENIESGILVGIIKSGNFTFGLIIYALDGYENQLKQVLLNTKKISWNKFPLIQGVIPKHLKIIQEVVKKKNLNLSTYADSTIQIINPEKALNYEIAFPDEVYIASLTKDEVNIIYDLWPLKDVHTKDDIANSIEYSFSFGVFSKIDNELLAWVMQSHYGAIGMLYTKENVRRHGYAKILVQMMAKRMAELCIPSYATIVETNTKSISLFHTLGFEQISLMKYLKVHD